MGPSTITGVLSRLIGGFRGHLSPGAMVERMSCRKSMAPAGTGQGHLGSDRNGQELLMAMRRGLAISVLGTRMLSTPSSSFASTLSASTLSGSWTR